MTTKTIPLVTPKEVAEEIRTNLNPKRAPGFNMITGTILKKFQRKGLVKLITLINASIRLKHVPGSRKVSEVIKKKNKQTPWPLVRERTIPTERPPLVDEI
jgi:hypothetical protein